MVGKTNIGAKLVLDGEKEYKSALSSVGKELAVLTSEARKTSAEFGNNKSSLAALKAATDNYQKSADAQKKKVEILREAYKNSKKQLGENADKTQDWKIKLNNAEAALTKTEKALKNSTAELKAHGKVIGPIQDEYKKWKEKIEDVKKAHPHLTSAMSKVGDAGKSLASGGLKLLSGGLKTAAAGMAAVGAAAVAATKQLADMISETAAYGDNVDKASQRIGLSSEAYQELDYAMQLAGADIGTFETGMKSLLKSMDAVSEGNATATANFEKLGVAVTDSSGKLRSQEDVLFDSIKAFQQMENSSEKNRLAQELFGKQGQALLPLLSDEAESIDSVRERAEKLGLVMSDKAVKASAAFQDSLSTLKGVFTGIKNDLMAEFLPSITEVMDGLTALFTGEEGAEEKIRKGVMDIAEAFQEISPRIQEILSLLIETIAAVAPDIISTLANGILGNLDQIIEAAGEILTALITAIADNLGLIVGSAILLITTLAGTLLAEENITKIIEAAVTLIVDLATSLVDNVDHVIDAAFNIIDSLVDELCRDGNLQKLIGAAITLVAKIGLGLIQAIPDLLSNAGKLIQSLVDAILEYDWAALGRRIWEGVKNAFTGKGKDEADENDAPGSFHAGGISYVPYDGYTAILHKGEAVKTASENAKDNDISGLTAKVDYLIEQQSVQQKTDVNVNISGTAAAVVRALNIAVERENRRRTAFA